MADFDSPWKEALDVYFQAFLAFFFPAIHNDINWSRGFEFLDRLMSVAIPRIRDFRGLNPSAFDGRGNYSLGVREQIIFPEVDYDEIDQVRGLDITITTTAPSDEEAFALLEALGMPFARDPRTIAAE